MCGIYGAFGHSAHRLQTLDGVVSCVLRHRGPDDAGFECGADWALGFRRLSILDLSAAGHQPMTTPNRRRWLVFNGEIYNYLELRSEIERDVEPFVGRSDSEVLLRLLARDGAAAIPRLNGMFAFAYVDTEARQFIVARDRLGVKPLYLQRKQGELRFASELKALMAWPDADRNVDPAALAEYLALGYLPSELSIFRGYSKLPPGTYLAGSLDRPDEALPRSYWRPELNNEHSSDGFQASQLEELRELLADATRIRLRSDVPVGVFLSGGIDSGLVAAFVAANSSAIEPLALTVAFDDEEYDEHDLAAQTADALRLSQRVVHQPAGGLRDIDEIAWYFDEPFGDPSALPTFNLCRAAAQHATVFLSGDGGDEAFGGYRRYVEAHRNRRVAAIAQPIRYLMSPLTAVLPTLSPLRYRLKKLTLPDNGFAAAFDGLPNDPAFGVVAGEQIREGVPVAGASLWDRWSGSRDDVLLARQQRLDLTLYLPDDILVKVDRASMAHSIEVRSPFLDYRVIEWAGRLPRNLLLNEGEGKLPLRRLASELLPHNVHSARKRGFGVPLDRWFREAEGFSFARDRLLSSEALARKWWNAEGTDRILHLHKAGRSRPFGLLLWRLLMLDAWARQYVDNRPAASPFQPHFARVIA